MVPLRISSKKLFAYKLIFSGLPLKAQFSFLSSLGLIQIFPFKAIFRGFLHVVSAAMLHEKFPDGLNLENTGVPSN
jgi:hypothetical protein